MTHSEQQTTILVVDDEAANLGVLFEHLGQAGFTVLIAEDGASALRRVAWTTPDIILLDIKLPDMDGFELCRRLKAQPQLADTPYIFLTALDDTQAILKGLDLSAVDYITKPFQPEEVVVRIKKHLLLSQLRQQLEAQNAQLQQEIAERKRAEAALQDSKEALEAILAASPVGIGLVKNRILDWANDMMYQMLGYTPGELLGESAEVLYPDHEEYERVGRELYGSMRQLGVGHVETCFKRKDGSIFSCYLQIRSLASDPSKGQIVVAVDITERKQIEDVLRTERDKAQHYFDIAGTILVVIAKDETISLINQKGCDILGYRQHEIIGKNWFDMFLPERIRERIRAIFNGLIAGDLEPFEYTEGAVMTINGEERLIAWHNTVLKDKTGQITATLSSGEDITERKRIEAELQHAKEAAEAANRAKSNFLANMSHELRTPLNAILGFAQLMGRNPKIPPEERENLHIIQRSGEHLLSLINQVLDLSKIEAGRITLEEKHFDLYCLLDELENIFRLRAEQKGLLLIFEYRDDVPQYIRTDQVKLRQVLINLLNNAMKFTKEGGVTVRIADCRLQIADLKESKSKISNLKFEIEDTGPGIAPEEVDKLFEAFAQTETGRQAREGTGLGLPISKKFVQLMGGDIRVRSEVGTGTTFTFDIQVGLVDQSKIENQQSKISKQTIALEPGQPRYRLLIVDDKPDNRKVLVKILNPFGFALKEATNGQEAIEIWEAWEPHLIWMDLRMPVMDGYEATKRIREAEERKKEEQNTKHQIPNTKIIVLSAIIVDEERIAVIAAGCDDFLRKPFREQEIFDLLHKHLGARFVYEEEQQAAGSRQQVARQEVRTPEALAALPTELVTRLQHAVEALNIDTANCIIDQIQQQNASLADALRELVKGYRFDMLQELLKERT